MKVGLIGLGAIGTFLLDKLNRDECVAGCRIVALLDERDARKKKEKLVRTGHDVKVYGRLDDFLQSGVEIIIEAANIQAAAHYAPRLLSQGLPVILCSTGCLADSQTVDAITMACRQGGSRCYVPSGAIGGLDLIQAANVCGGLSEVSITSLKPTRAFDQRGEELDKLQVLFEGNAHDAITQFPRNVNSAVTLSLAGIGSERTRVRIVKDSRITQNIHEIRAVWAFGELELRVRNAPIATNPKTSYLAALSVLSTLVKMASPIWVG